MISFDEALKSDLRADILCRNEVLEAELSKGGILISCDGEINNSVFLVIVGGHSRFVNGLSDARRIWAAMSEGIEGNSWQEDLEIVNREVGVTVIRILRPENAIHLFNSFSTTGSSFILVASELERRYDVSFPKQMESLMKPGDLKFYWRCRYGQLHVRRLSEILWVLVDHDRFSVREAYNIATDYRSLFEKGFGDGLAEVLPRRLYSRLTSQRSREMFGFNRICDSGIIELDPEL